MERHRGAEVHLDEFAQAQRRDGNFAVHRDAARLLAELPDEMDIADLEVARQQIAVRSQVQALRKEQRQRVAMRGYLERVLQAAPEQRASERQAQHQVLP
ncbi:MAG: hypothetical protein WB987_04490, partial [Candidatus Acidiferrales bacterium]